VISNKNYLLLIKERLLLAQIRLLHSPKGTGDRTRHHVPAALVLTKLSSVSHIFAIAS